MTREEKIKGLIALIDYANEALEQEQNCSEIPTGSTTKTCRSCRNFGSHHGICEICKDNKCWTEKKPIERYHSRNLKAYADDMGVSVEQAEKELLIEEPTTKNDLAVEKIVDVLGSYTDLDIPYKHKIAEDILNNLPSVTPQEPQSFKWCTDCKEYDQEKHCCHRYSKVIRDTVAEIGQEPKTGNWISHREHCENLGVMPSGLGAYEWCSNCDCGIDVREWHRNHYNYCPNCGARMIEPQESEDKK